MKVSPTNYIRRCKQCGTLFSSPFRKPSNCNSCDKSAHAKRKHNLQTEGYYIQQ